MSSVAHLGPHYYVHYDLVIGERPSGCVLVVVIANCILTIMIENDNIVVLDCI